MTDNPFDGGFPVPTRTERRGDFPPHADDYPHPLMPLTGPRALAIARQHLADWVADRDHRADYGSD